MDQSKMNVVCNIKQVVKFGFNNTGLERKLERGEKTSKIDMVIRKELSKFSEGVCCCC